MRRRIEAAALLLLATGAVAGLTLGEIPPPSATGRIEFADRRSPPAWRNLDEPAQEAFDLGLLVFNSPWVIAGTNNAGRRDGLGPLFIQASCDGCHNNGARGRGEPPDGLLPNSFVMQLDGPAGPYGAVFNTRALPGYTPEGRIEVQWRPRTGRYGSGESWQIREPRYALTSLGYGELSADAILRPRIAPAIFGTGLLQAVPATALQEARAAQPRAQRGEIAWQDIEGRRLPGRFGWRAESVSVEDQTARALAREMGLSSRPRAQDDCTEQQWQCRDAPQGGTPEVSDEFLHALVVLQQEMAVPLRPATLAADQQRAGAALFAKTGCAACHVPTLPVQPEGFPVSQISAYTDLLVHDLGEGLADRRLDGRPVPTLWRTAPLWGMAHAIANGDLALLHDGRARNIEEAVLWHGGQARGARRSFEKLPATQRALLLAWVGSL